NKADYLEAVKSGVFKVESFEVADLKVHVYGNAAVAIGLAIINAHSKSGFGQGAVRSTDTYVRRSGCWQCVAWHAMGIADLPETHAAQLQEILKSVELAVPEVRSRSPYVLPLEQFKSAETKVAPSASQRPKTAPSFKKSKRALRKAAPDGSEP